MKTKKPFDGNPFRDPIFASLLGISAILLVGFIAKETLHFSNAPWSNTRSNEVKRESLPGGSRVWLNANTHFSYGTPWLSTLDKDLWIKGEGWFELKRWGAFRYVIHTPYVDVISTEGEFSVQNIEDKARVYNKSGVLILRAGPENKFREFFMHAGEYYEFDKGQVIKKDAPAAESFSWIERAVIK